MKMMVKLTVLLATLLLLTGLSFAQVDDCHMYEYVWTNLDDPEQSGTWCSEICFNSGTFSGFCDESGRLFLFFDSMKKQALWYSTSTSTDPYVGYLKFHGDWLYIFNGIDYCYGARFEIRGHKVEECIPPV